MLDEVQHSNQKIMEPNNTPKLDIEREFDVRKAKDVDPETWVKVLTEEQKIQLDKKKAQRLKEIELNIVALKAKKEFLKDSPGDEGRIKNIERNLENLTMKKNALRKNAEDEK